MATSGALQALRSARSLGQAALRLRQLHTTASSREEPEQSTTSSVMPKIVVFGGRGYVGSHICKEALSTGLGVLSISRAGTPPVSEEPWHRDVEWVRGNVLEPMTYLQHLTGAVAAISCVGGFGNQQEMLKVNGAANVTAIETCKNAGVARFVLISATVPKIPGIDMLLSGYINGKAQAEEALRVHYPESGVALRPSVIYGDRVITNQIKLPLGMLFQPLESALSHAPKNLADLPVIGGVFVPPVSVNAVARAAVAAATDPSVPAGIMDLEAIRRFK